MAAVGLGLEPLGGVWGARNMGRWGVAGQAAERRFIHHSSSFRQKRQWSAVAEME